MSLQTNKSALYFQTMSLTTARIVALLTLAGGISGAVFCLYKLSHGEYFIGITGTLLSLLFVGIGFRGPATVQLYADVLVIRRGVWTTPIEFLLKEIKELRFETNKKGGVFVVRTASAEETFQFNQHGLVVVEFAKQLEALKVRVSGKR